jgi:hypothetical protein
MVRREEVERFLEDFTCKLEYWGLYIRTDRTNPKNTLTLLELELTHAHVRKILEKLEPEDYSKGPLADTLYNFTEMWVFGKIIKGREIYIKIQLGRPQSQAICISFHFAEHKMEYPLKK